MVTGDKKIINGWALYDWANSVYSLVIVSAIFPQYYNSVTSSKGSDLVQFMGLTIKNTVLYSYALSLSFLVIVFLSPLLSSIADCCGNKKSFMKFFSTMGAISCATMYFFKSEEQLWLGILAFVMASIGFAGSIVFYNAYLPEIAAPADQDKVSAKGFAMGYIGSSLLLILNLLMILKPEWFPDFLDLYAPGHAPRLAFLSVGIWWFGFAQITFMRLPTTPSTRVSWDILFKGYKELQKVWKQLKYTYGLKQFLLSFFFYNMGVQTVMYVATLFGDKELKLASDELIIIILIIQFVGIAGAFLFSHISKLKGNNKALSIAIVIWVFICIGAYFVQNAQQFFMVAFVVGLVMGGIQSLSRSTYSKLLPETQDHASYFSFFDVCDKLGIVLGTASYGLIEQLTGSMRNSIIALISFFIIGLIFLSRIKKQ